MVLFYLQLVLLVAWIDAASVPILYCVNEVAAAGECSAEASLAAESTKDWFDAYIATHSNQKRERRHLLDCSRFCSSNIAYFTIHYPCDCKKDRRLTAVDVPEMSRSLQYSPSYGPIQLFKSFTTQLPANDCRTILEMSRCIITFVDKYDHDISVSAGKEESESGNVPSDFYINEAYNPETGKYEMYDPTTGELAKPVDTNSDEAPEEVYDPITQKYYMVDPKTGAAVGEGSSTPRSSGSGNEDGSVDEIYDPVTGKYQKIDPITGKFIYDEGEAPTDGRDGDEIYQDEVYDPVTKETHKIDPNTGEYIEDVKEYEEVYDPTTGTYRKIDVSTGKYVD